MSWPVVLLACAGCYLLKLAGLVVPPRWLDQAAVQRVAGLLPIALLSSLIVLNAASTGSRLVVDARLVGVAAAALAALLRAPFLVIVVVGAAATALVRAFV